MDYSWILYISLSNDDDKTAVNVEYRIDDTSSNFI